MVLEELTNYYLQLPKYGKAAVIGILAGAFAMWWLRKVARLPFGPRGVPFLGSILDLKDDTMETLTEWSIYFGQYMLLYIGRVPTIFLNSRIAVDEAFVKEPTAFSDRPSSFAADKLSGGRKGILEAQYTPTLQHQRRVISMAFRSYSFLPAFGLELKVNKSVDKVIDLLKTELTPLDPDRYVSLIVLNIMNGICFNTIEDIDNKELCWLMDQLNDLRSNTKKSFWEDYLPLLRKIPTSRFRRSMRIVDQLKEHVKQKLEQHRDTFDAEHVRDVTDAILLSMMEDEDSGEDEAHRLTDDDVVYTIIDLFKAGHDSTRFTILWILLYLASNPDVQEKVHIELDAALGSKMNASLTDRSDLHYLQAVINETMRLTTVLPLGRTHTPAKNCKLIHYDVNIGTNLVANHWFLNHDPEVWEDPDTFKPERFLNDDHKIKNTTFIPFSVGRRSCLGEYIVKANLVLIVAALLKRFKIVLPEDNTADLTPLYVPPFNIPKQFKVMFKTR